MHFQLNLYFKKSMKCLHETIEILCSVIEISALNFMYLLNVPPCIRMVSDCLIWVSLQREKQLHMKYYSA